MEFSSFATQVARMQHIGAEAVAGSGQPPLPQLLLQGQQEVHRCQDGGGGRAGEEGVVDK